MRYVIVQLTRSEASERVSEFRPWEVPILKLIHGEPYVNVVGEIDYPKVPYPDPYAEYERLDSRYKHGEESEVGYTRQVYGIGPVQLAKAISEAQEDEQSRAAIPYEPVKPLDMANRGYMQAEAASLAADRAAVAAERAQAAKEAQEREAAKQAEFESREAALAAREKALADAEAALARDQAEVAAALDAATQTPPPAQTPAPAKAKAAAKAQPISE